MGVLGKIFSSSSNLAQLEHQQKQQQQQQPPPSTKLLSKQSPPQPPPPVKTKPSPSNGTTVPDEDDEILSQVENDIVTPLRQIKQPQPQHPTSVNTPTVNSIRSNNSSPRLIKTRSVSPSNGLSSSTTSPMSLELLEDKLKNHQIASPTGSSTQPVAISSNDKPSTGRPSPTVSRTSSFRKPPSRATSVKTRSNSVSSTNLSGSSTNTNPVNNLPRFVMLESGNHEHHLRSAKRQEKLSNMLKDLLGAKKLRGEAKSAVPDIFQGAMQSSTSQLSQQQQQQPQPVKPPTLFAEKYGRCQEVVGRGSFGVVRISHKKLDSTSTTEKLFAVKEFKRKPNESEKKYNRRLTSEFCISSSLKHNNIIDTLDLLKDAKGDYCEVMEFCSGGDLYTLIIAAGKLEYAEADCFFKQLIRGVNYMHDMGVAHRDLKPENLLLTQNGVLKITDFGNSECFKMAWENEIQYSDGICGSSPYIAPEEYNQESFDPRCVDIWSCGVIYMAMRTGRQLWKLADPKKDEFFEEYLVKRKESSGYEPIESLKRARCRNVIYSILDPKPERRITGKQILSSEWGREIKVCEAGEGHLNELGKQ
ncbi:Protein kinase domain family protein [Candida albicans]|uniref:non-specific serine/threonine protein kinase n=1 Tax=Candida albicans TaxID=5476 RepID=A0A8H6F3W6_CANAX|nr:Protein kinase domain family protein [Candida albicans]